LPSKLVKMTHHIVIGLFQQASKMVQKNDSLTILLAN